MLSTMNINMNILLCTFSVHISYILKKKLVPLVLKIINFNDTINNTYCYIRKDSLSPHFYVRQG